MLNMSCLKFTKQCDVSSEPSNDNRDGTVNTDLHLLDLSVLPIKIAYITYFKLVNGVLICIIAAVTCFAPGHGCDFSDFSCLLTAISTCDPLRLNRTKISHNLLALKPFYTVKNDMINKLLCPIYDFTLL